MTIRPDAFAEGSAAMAETVGYFNANSDYDFTLWQVLLGYPVGSVAVATRFESYGPYTDAMAELNARPETLAATSAVGASLAANPDDSLWQVVHTAGDAPEPANVVSNFAWQVDPDQVPASMAWAVEMATFMNGLSGTPVVVGFSQYGEPNTFRFMFGYDTIADLEERTAVTQADPGFAERLAAAGEIGSPRDTQTGIARRVL